MPAGKPTRYGAGEEWLEPPRGHGVLSKEVPQNQSQQLRPGRGRWAWWGSHSFSEAGAGGGIAFCSVYVWDGNNGKPEASPGGRASCAAGPRAACSAPLTSHAAAAFWGKQAGEGTGPRLTTGGLQGAEATLPSALAPPESIPQQATLGTPTPVQPAPLPRSAPLAAAPSQHRWRALSRRRFPGCLAHWVNGCRILIPLELQQRLPSVVSLSAGPAPGLVGRARGAHQGTAGLPAPCGQKGWTRLVPRQS